MRKITFTIMNEERWLPVVGYEGYYEVSDHGRVRSLDRVVLRKDGVQQRCKGMIRAQSNDQDGYKLLKLRGAGKKPVTAKVHRLVLGAFNPIQGMDELEVRHGDDTPSNNVLTNLSWGTHQDNIDDRQSRSRQARGSRAGLAKLTNELVLQIRRMREIGFGYETIGYSIGVSPATVWQVSTGATWSHV